MDKVDRIIKENKEIWKTRAAFFSYLKGVIRKGWNFHPIKLKLLNKKAVKMINTNPKSAKRFPYVNGWKCEKCGVITKDKHIDHIVEDTAKLTELSHIQACVEKLLVVCEDDLRILCEDCHAIVTLSQKLGITFEQAELEKYLINLIDKEPRASIQLFLSDYGYQDVKVKDIRDKLRDVFIEYSYKEK